jgi:hypothetical protein
MYLISHQSHGESHNGVALFRGRAHRKAISGCSRATHSNWCEGRRPALMPRGFCGPRLPKPSESRGFEGWVRGEWQYAARYSSRALKPQALMANPQCFVLLASQKLSFGTKSGGFTTARRTGVAPRKISSGCKRRNPQNALRVAAVLAVAAYLGYVYLKEAFHALPRHLLCAEHSSQLLTSAICLPEISHNLTATSGIRFDY